ncbi:MerR family transcriptional regulator, partial [Streptomyces vinaceusdrappus]
MLTSHDGLCGIGELAERAGVTVKTVRFYSDRGLLPEAARSAGGHRRYGSDALGRLRLIRSLRALGLSVPQVRRVLLPDPAPLHIRQAPSARGAYQAQPAVYVGAVPPVPAGASGGRRQETPVRV